jgi:phage terminase large subunit-like protein
LNQPTADEQSWVTPQQWSALARPEIKVAHRERIVMFFDGSKSRDATALIGCRMSDGHVFTLGVWEPQGEANVDAEAVDSTVKRAFDDYDVMAFFADVKEWEGFVKVNWPATYHDLLLVMASPTTREPGWIAWDMRARRREFAEACETCEAEISDRQFTHDGNAVVARHVGNARRWDRDGRIAIGKESPNSPHKVDAAVCVVGARMARRVVLASKEWEKLNRPRGGGRVIVMS